ncbi:MAG: sugar isomerase [Candidatus Sumerlaeia bacterium]|nr:sugar isomerase [Candidatus Sumerlaeia bacterium]
MTQWGNGKMNMSALSGCCGHYGDLLLGAAMSRRQFLAATGATAGGAVLSGDLLRSGGGENRQRPIRLPLRVQPVFNCEIYPRKEAVSWRVTGAIQDEREMREEEARIRRDLEAMRKQADFPLEIKPLVTVQTVEQAKAAVAGANFDVQILYAARRNRPVLEALADNDKWNLMFVRHRSGPLYYMYIGGHTHFLRKTRDEFGQPNMTTLDIVVDEHAELLWRLRTFYGLKNTLGRRIIAIGAPSGWGEAGKGAPERAAATFKLDIQTLPYPELGKMIAQARQDSARVKKCQNEADAFMRRRGITIETPKDFVWKAFLLTDVFRDVLDGAGADALTVGSCMSTIMPMSETTACLPLMLLNDEGYMAFCESDFVVIPSGILLHHISGRPVFFCNPSFPHNGLMTLSHCTAPCRMDGRNDERVRILTHYESDYGAAPKVEMRKGQTVTVVNPDFGQKRWLGFEGKIVESPFYPICRTQIDLEIRGDWEKLRDETRGFHHMLCYGTYLREMGYAVRKAGLDWLNV